MGFPSPAKDYVERTLSPNILCHIDGNCRVIETSAGYAVINTAIRPKQGSNILISMCGLLQFAVVRGKAIITEDGEAIEGDALDDVDVKGVLTFLVNRVDWQREDDIPIM